MLTDQQAQQYCDQGYVLANGIFADHELDELEREFDGIIQRRLRNKTNLDATWGGAWKKDIPIKTEILHTHDVQAYSAAWTRALVHDRFTEAFADLIGPNVQLHHTKLFMKPPEKGSAFPMHQDAPYFPHAKHTMMAGIIHLTNATPEMGCVCVYPGSHRRGLLPVMPDGLYLDPKEWPIEQATLCPAQRGDVLFFHYLTIHGSGVNRSQQVRKTVLVQVRNPEDQPTADVHKSHAQGLMLRGIDPLTARARGDGVLG